jgi:XTP/dITP diphosphohydrolase
LAWLGQKTMSSESTMGDPRCRTLLVATSNPGKLREFRAILPSDIPVIGLAEAGATSPDETGTTFRENAALKASAAARATGLLTIADDSGIEVGALGGEPGVRSARYAGEPSNAARNRRALLNALERVPAPDRGARFVCVVALANRQGVIAMAEGELPGTIASQERGGGGFGYDPIFEVEDGRTVAELPAAEKNRRSHRAAAIAAILPALRAALSDMAVPSGTRR